MSGFLAIVGRPNVGKSTLYNRLVEARDAIVDDQSGVTRDRHYGQADWSGFEFTVIDTGGYVETTDDLFEKEIKKQVHIALEEADVIIFMCDVRTGITDQDDAFVKVLRGVKKPVLVAANKSDNSDLIYQTAEFYAFGFDEVFPISSVSGSGTGELLDRAVEMLRKNERKTEVLEEGLPKFCVLGKPNVGKSTFINALLGEERNIVADIPGTTRDSIHTLYNKFDKKFYLIDTAGIRKKSSVSENIEFYSVMRAIRALEYSDVAFVVIDATEGITAQDLNLISLAMRRKKGLVILINKWDKLEKETNTMRDYERLLREKMAPFTDVPIIFTSALEKTRIFQALEEGLQVYENLGRRISTSELNDWLQETMKRHPVPSYGGRHVKIKYMTQLPPKTPVFAFFCNMPNFVVDSYRRYLENEMRKTFKFSGVPVKFAFKKK
mgnify:CR=1 FL=1